MQDSQLQPVDLSLVRSGGATPGIFVSNESGHPFVGWVKQSVVPCLQSVEALNLLLAHRGGFIRIYWISRHRARNSQAASFFKSNVQIFFQPPDLNRGGG